MVTFELCELANQEIKRQVKLLSLDHWSCLTPAEAARFHGQFGSMDFRLDTPPGNGKKVVTAVLDWLRQHGPHHVLPVGAAGSTIPYWCIPGLERIKGVIHVTANAGGYVGPIFNVSTFASFGSGVEEAIRNKATKTYQLGSSDVTPKLLLHYSDDDPFMRGYRWEQQPDGLRDLWEPHFTDIWIFKERPPEVLSHYVHESRSGSAQMPVAPQTPQNGVERSDPQGLT
jgi:hypothetical protein